MAKLLQLFKDLRLGFALDDFAETKWKNLTGTTRWATARGAAQGRAPPDKRQRHCRGGPGIQTLKKDLATRVARKGGQWSPLRASGQGPQRAAPRDGARRARRRGEAAGHRVQ